MAIQPISLNAGSQITAKLINALIAEINANRIVPSSTVSVSRGIHGTTLKVESGGKVRASDDTQPFDMAPAVDDNGNPLVEVYLPVGSVATSDECVALNGRRDDADEDWRIVSDVDIADGQEAWIEALVMPGRHFVVRQVPSSEDSFSKGRLARYMVGKVKARVDDEGKKTYAVTSQNTRGSRSVSEEVMAPNGLVYTLEDTEDGGKKVSSVKVSQVSFDAGGLILSAADKTIAEGTAKVFLRIDHATNDYALSVVEDPAGDDAKSDDDKTVIQIYEMAGNYPKTDYRRSVNVLFYR